MGDACFLLAFPIPESIFPLSDGHIVSFSSTSMTKCSHVSVFFRIFCAPDDARVSLDFVRVVAFDAVQRGTVGRLFDIVISIFCIFLISGIELVYSGRNMLCS